MPVAAVNIKEDRERDWVEAVKEAKARPAHDVEVEADKVLRRVHSVAQRTVRVAVRLGTEINKTLVSILETSVIHF